MDFDVEILNLPHQNFTAIKITTNNGKTFSTVIKNRYYPDDTKAIVSQTILKLVCQSMKELVKEKREEKGIEFVRKNSRPNSLKYKRDMTEEQR